jgi:hypothetical protein
MGFNLTVDLLLTRISAFLLTLRLECAFTMPFTVPRGYSFCVAAIVRGFEGKVLIRIWIDSNRSRRFTRDGVIGIADDKHELPVCLGVSRLTNLALTLGVVPKDLRSHMLEPIVVLYV